MAVIDFGFRRKLNAAEGGFGHNYCFQCGTCVGDCPAARYSELFNPRLIMLQALLGLEDRLLAADSPIWDCTNCFTCVDRCPQDVKPADVIIALKNLAVERRSAPRAIETFSDEVLRGGRSVKAGSMTHRRRQELGLAGLPDAPAGELRELLDGAATATGDPPATAAGSRDPAAVRRVAIDERREGK